MRAASPVFVLPAIMALLAFAATPAPPAIDQGGVVNAASRMPASLPGGALARGARFSLSGVRLGPEHAVEGDQSAPPTSLGSVAVHIMQGSKSVDAGLFLVSAERIEGWIPDSAPLGPVQLRVTYQERTSEPYVLTLLSSNVGFFIAETAPVALPGSASEASATPGERVAVWGTGVEDNAIEILVGGHHAAVTSVAAAVCCRGVERVEFQVPADAPRGCYVPVQARGADGRMSNTVGIAIHEVGRPCQDQVDWFRESVEHASRAGFVVLASISLADSAEEYRLDYGLGSFGRQETGQRPLPATPPFHTCTQTTETINFRQVLGQARSPSTWTSIPRPVPGNRRLDAGTTLQVSGPRGARQLGRDPQRLEFYNALLGGHVPLTRTPPAPLFLRPGAYTIAGMGGADIGAFSSRLQVLRPIAWTNRAQIQEVERDRGVTVEWSASWKTDAVLIAAGSSDRFSGDSALAVCLAPAREGRFLIPATALANLPASGEGRGLEAGYLLIAEIPIQPPARIRASGLDSGFAAFVSASARTVRYK